MQRRMAESRNRQKLAFYLPESLCNYVSLDTTVDPRRFDVIRFEGLPELNIWMTGKSDVVLVICVLLSEQLLKAAAVIQLALDQGNPVILLSDIEERAGQSPTASELLKSLKEKIDFLPLTADEKLLDQTLATKKKGPQKTIRTPPVSFLFLNGKAHPQSFEQLLEAYDQGIHTLNRHVPASQCTLIAQQKGTGKYKIVGSSEPGLVGQDWDDSFTNIVPKRDIISSKSYHYFQPISACLSERTDQRLTGGYIFISRTKTARVLNQSEAHLLEILADEIAQVSGNFAAKNKTTPST